MKIPSIDTLHAEKSQKEKVKMDIFSIVLKKCIEKIVYTNRYTDKTFVYFEVPKILIGQPSYDMNSCIIFLINRLSASGYLVEFMEPFYLYVDWGSKNKQKTTLNKLIKHFPGRVEFVYEDQQNQHKKKKK